MSTHDFPWNGNASVLTLTFDRNPVGLRPTSTTLSLDFMPDLTAEELAAVTAVVAEAVATTGDLRRMSLDDFMALPAEGRDRLVFDALRVLLRE